MALHPSRLLSTVLFLLAAAILVLGNASGGSLPEVRYPDPDIGVDSLAARKKAQMDTVDQFKVFYGFHLTDQVKQSGITFVNHVVDDAGIDYKPVHYDHGNGIAVADVDGDGLYDIYFVNQVGGNELWKNLGGGKFKNITKEAGVGMPGRISVSASFADIDNDGTQDLFVTTVLGGNVLFKNDGHGHFRDITKEAGLDLVSHSSGAVFFDYNDDGLLDLLVCNVGKYTSEKKGAQGQYIGLPDAFGGHLHPQRFEYPVLYKNLGHDRFKDVTAEAGLRPTGWCGDATFTDPKGKGFPDLFILNMQGHDHYLENEGGKQFVDKTEQYFPKTPWGAMGVKFFDFDNDGRMDLIVTDMHSDMSESVGPEREKMKSTMRWPDSFTQAASHDDYIWGNAFYHRLENGHYEEISDRIGVENYWPWGVSVGDLNADGWDDIFIASGMSFPFRYGINSMLLNNRGERFLDAEFLLGIEPRKDIYVPWFDLDCSQKNLTDLNQKVCAGRSGKIRVLSPRSSRSSVMFDLDNDGDLDIVTNEFNSAPQVLISDLEQQKAIHWLKVVLVGTRSNRDGLGATVRLQAGGQTYTKYNDGKSGYLSQSVLPLYFGLGATEKIDRIEVDWPSGQTQVITSGLGENQLLRVTEPK
ncbi:MAG TPA: CRTAC1 family protein [Candidatus Sulfotelmatobacter sp.]|nr:CRTAC1 family protein [Candidatus Sulfotelmatobacter sp.]